MTCRHQDPINNVECTSYRTPSQQLELLDESARKIRERFKIPQSPDNSEFEIIDCLELFAGIVLKVRYESCVDCSYEGTKVLVYIGATTKDVLRWRTIDPHFSDKPPGPRQAPSPTARFPASKEGWEMAVSFVVRCGGGNE